MARLAVIMREKKRIKERDKFAEKRMQLKEEIRLLQHKLLNQQNVDDVLFDELNLKVAKFRAMPRNSSPCRVRNRCAITGRSRGVYRKVGLGRSMFRLYAMRGEIPGITKSSW